jgi:hypothetical protein
MAGNRPLSRKNIKRQDYRYARLENKKYETVNTAHSPWDPLSD